MPAITPSINCHFIQFITGRKPLDEIAHPGLGSSDNAGIVLPLREQNYIYLLYRIQTDNDFSPDFLDNCKLFLTLSFVGQPTFVSGEINPQIFANQAEVAFHTVKLSDVKNKTLVIRLEPNKDFPVDENQFSFENLFSQQLQALLEIKHEHVLLSSDKFFVDLFNCSESDNLYKRIINTIIKPDTLKQTKDPTIHFSYHPLFPVLSIGLEKALLYKIALTEDIVYKKHYFMDPGWLKRVGLYLEFLTFLGIVETVKEDLGDLLTTFEREAYEHSPQFAKIRQHVNLSNWKSVWSFREILLPSFGIPTTGRVSAFNLLQKETATLAFLEIHHQDLKYAIEIAGKNIYNAQESWYRVFRDAERAVLLKTNEAFPELQFVSTEVKNYILWKGNEEVDLWTRLLLIQKAGLYEQACEKYRKSLNEVAKWAKDRCLIDYTGEVCIPIETSLLNAYIHHQTDLFNQLQQRDGYNPKINIEIQPSKEFQFSVEEISELLKQISIFDSLSEDEQHQTALAARTINLGHMERITIQGREGSSLFILAKGHLEVILRQSDGTDQVVNEMIKGEVFGEMSILTNTPRLATIRAVGEAIVIEISKQQFEMITLSKPKMIVALTALMLKRQKQLKKFKKMHKKMTTKTLFNRVWSYFIGNK